MEGKWETKMWPSPEYLKECNKSYKKSASMFQENIKYKMPVVRCYKQFMSNIFYVIMSSPDISLMAFSASC